MVKGTCNAVFTVDSSYSLLKGTGKDLFTLKYTFYIKTETALFMIA